MGKQEVRKHFHMRLGILTSPDSELYPRDSMNWKEGHRWQAVLTIEGRCGTLPISPSSGLLVWEETGEDSSCWRKQSAYWMGNYGLWENCTYSVTYSHLTSVNVVQLASHNFNIRKNIISLCLFFFSRDKLLSSHFINLPCL